MIEKKQAMWAGFARWVADNYRPTVDDGGDTQSKRDRLVSASAYVDTERAAFGAIVAAGYSWSGVPQLRDIWLASLASQDIAAPGSDRAIINPPDLGKLRPAEDVAREIVRVGRVDTMYSIEFGPVGEAAVLDIRSHESGVRDDVEFVASALAGVIAQARADGAAEAMRAVAEVADACQMVAEEDSEIAADAATGGDIGRAQSLDMRSKAYAGIAKMLRLVHPATTRSAIINPPDLGREATSEIRSRIGLPDSDRGIITPPDMGRPGPDALTRGAERGSILGPPDLGRAALEDLVTTLEKRVTSLRTAADRNEPDEVYAAGQRAHAAGLAEAITALRDRIALPPGADRGFIEPPDLGKPGDVGFIEPPDMGRGK